MTTNEKEYLDKALNLKADIYDVQKYISENFNVNTKYDESSKTLYIYSSNINESLQCASAKHYLTTNTDLCNFIKVEYGNGQSPE